MPSVFTTGQFYRVFECPLSQAPFPIRWLAAIAPTRRSLSSKKSYATSGGNCLIATCSSIRRECPSLSEVSGIIVLSRLNCCGTGSPLSCRCLLNSPLLCSYHFPGELHLLYVANQHFLTVNKFG